MGKVNCVIYGLMTIADPAEVIKSRVAHCSGPFDQSQILTLL